MAKVNAFRALVDEQDLLLLEVTAPPGPVEPRPLDLVLVLDRSGSMAGSRLKAAREAAQALASVSAAGDARLGLVTFNQEVWAVDGWVGPQEAERLLDELEAEGATNLFAGWEAGAARLEDLPTQGLKAVLLLTDGAANRGLTDPLAITERVERAALRGVMTSTLGVGLGYNEHLLSEMAEAGGGTHLFLPDGEEGNLGPRVLEEFAFLRGAALDGAELGLWGARAEALLGRWRGSRGFVGPMAPGERRSLLLRLEQPGEEVSLEAEILLPKGREQHRRVLGEPEREGPAFERVFFELQVAEVRQLYRELAGVENEEQASLLRLQASVARLNLEGGSDPRVPGLLRQLERLEAALLQLSRRHDPQVLGQLSKAFICESDTLNSTRRRRAN